MKKTGQETLAGIRIDADAAAILNNACHAVETILARRRALDARGENDKPLVVLSGEIHSMPAHYVHHMMVLKQLKTAEPSLALACEYEHNHLCETFHRQTGQRASAELAENMRAQDNKGALTVKARLAWSRNLWADHSHATFSHFLLQQKIPVFFTDASVEGGSLNAADPSTAESMHACFGKAAGYLHPCSRHGQKIRNHHMAGRIVHYAAERQPRIIVQQCGIAHIAGDAADKWPASESLSSGIKAAGFPVLAEFLLSADFHKQSIPGDHELGEQEIIFVEGLSQKEAMYDEYARRPASRPYAVDFICRAQEAEYLNALLTETGMERHCLGIAQYKERREELADEMTGRFSRWAGISSPYCMR